MSKPRVPLIEMLDEIAAEPYLPTMVACTVAHTGMAWTTSDGIGWYASRTAIENGWRWMREQQVERDRRGGC
jgi:hypothetical protein